MDRARKTSDERGPTGSNTNRWIWPFELLEQIGEGGMGVVYRARYVVNNREVAVKILPKDVTDKTALARFERETEVLKDLKHPNIVRSFGGVCEDKCRFYAMELVEGGSLDDMIQRRGRLSSEQVMEYALQMCAALECSHKQGIVHRDVKPANFLIASNGQLKLSDFGLASVASQRKITQPGKTAGTFLYMAPEQIKGQEVTPRTDLYALGCVLFEMMTGKPPFAAETPAAMLNKHISEPAPRVSATLMDCPAVLDRLVERLLEKDPAKRPQSALEVARELRSVSQTVTVAPTRKRIGGQTTVGNQPMEMPTYRTTTTPAIETPIFSSRILALLLFATTVVAGLAIVSALIEHNAWQTESEHARQSEAMWIETATHSDSKVRMMALKNLAQLTGASEQVSEAVIHGLTDQSIEVRTAVVEAVGETGHSGDVYLTELKRLQQHDELEQIRTLATASMKKIQSAPEPPTSRWPAIAAALVVVVGALVWFFGLRHDS
ncbi:MAG: protein kinase [Planctomycetaceae bacterium]